jgi:copper chaperone NosL
MNSFKIIIFLLFSLSFIGCDSKDDFSPKKIHWDRDACERCKMIVSERNFAVQVINKQDRKAYNFDDIGCALLWFKEKNIAWKNDAIIHIMDFDTKNWVDARGAFYSFPNSTPMSYGFAAHGDKNKIANGKEVITFAEVQARIEKVGK